MKHFLNSSVKFLMVVFAILSLLPISIVFATPPAPPVQLQLPKAEELAALQPEKGAYSGHVQHGQDSKKRDNELALKQRTITIQGLNETDQGLSQHNESRVDQDQIPEPIQLAAMDNPEGPPPCGRDNFCNVAVCPNDPDCPADMPEINRTPPSDTQQHNEGGISGSVWLTTGPDGFEGGHFCPSDGDTCDIKVSWSVQPDRYDKWKICWKEYGDTFSNACDENQKIRKFENNFYVIPDLKKNERYRIRLEGRKDKNDHWKCLVKATLRNVSLNGTTMGVGVPCIVP